MILRLSNSKVLECAGSTQKVHRNCAESVPETLTEDVFLGFEPTLCSNVKVMHLGVGSILSLFTLLHLDALEYLQDILHIS